VIAQEHAERLRLRESGEPVPASQMPVTRCFIWYWEEHAKNLPSAFVAKGELARLTAFFADMTVGDVDDALVEAFKADQLSRNYAIASVSRCLSTFRAALRYAWKRRRLASVPYVKEVFEPHHRELQEPKGRRLTEAEMAALFAAATDRQMRRYLLLLAGTLGRPEAVRAVALEQVDFEVGCVRLNPRGRPQTKKFRPTVPLIETLRAELADARPGPLLAVDGKPVHDMKTAWRQLRRDAGVDPEVNPYSFRHTFSYWLKRARFPTAEIGQYLGHRPAQRMRSTEIYIGEEFESLIPAGKAIDEILSRVAAPAARG
jgi:integrase